MWDLFLTSCDFHTQNVKRRYRALRVSHSLTSLPIHFPFPIGHFPLSLPIDHVHTSTAPSSCCYLLSGGCRTRGKGICLWFDGNMGVRLLRPAGHERDPPLSLLQEAERSDQQWQGVRPRDSRYALRIFTCSNELYSFTYVRMNCALTWLFSRNGC